MRFLAKICPKNDFFAHFCTFCAHFCIILTECNVAPVVGHGRQVSDMISDIFFFKNGQKWPKTAKNGQKTRFFFCFFLLVFSLLCRHFICCNLKRSKIAKNSQKWPKIAQNGIFDRFLVRKNCTPPV